MKPRCLVDADSPDLDDAHIDLVLDPDKLRIDAYLVQGKSVSAGKTNVNRAPGWPENLLVFDGERHTILLKDHLIEVRRRWYNPNKWLPVLAWLMLYSAPQPLTTFAALLAGRKHSASRDEWMAHLAGEPGYQFGRWGQIRASLGFVAAAVRFRAEDTADLAWIPVDAILRSRFLSGIFITGPVFAVVLMIMHLDGRSGLVLNIQDPFCVGACTWGTIFGLRKWRKVQPPEHRPRRAKE
jgi:hypothetical protein